MTNSSNLSKSQSSKNFLITETKHHIFAIALFLTCLLVMFLAPWSTELFRYEYVTTSEGQVWRLFTANLCHSNWNHWLLNMTGLILMDLFFRPVLSVRSRAYLLIFCMVGNVILLHLFMQLKWYVGLSGALHGYLMGGAIISWHTAKRLNSVIIAVVSIKLFVEYFWQINSSTEQLIEANVVEEAHFFGAVASVAFSIFYYSVKKLRFQ